jgi:hypothetical protein
VKLTLDDIKLGAGTQPRAKIDEDVVLYVVLNPKTKLVKIGVTENLDRRLGQLENSTGVDITILAWAQCKQAKELESLLHKTFTDFRKKGEWFELFQSEMSFLSSFWKIYFSNYSESGFTSWDEINNPSKDAWIFPWSGTKEIKKESFNISKFNISYPKKEAGDS